MQEYNDSDHTVDSKKTKRRRKKKRKSKRNIYIALGTSIIIVFFAAFYLFDNEQTDISRIYSTNNDIKNNFPASKEKYILPEEEPDTLRKNKEKYEKQLVKKEQDIKEDMKKYGVEMEVLDYPIATHVAEESIPVNNKDTKPITNAYETKQESNQTDVFSLKNQRITKSEDAEQNKNEVLLDKNNLQTEGAMNGKSFVKNSNIAQVISKEREAASLDSAMKHSQELKKKSTRTNKQQKTAKKNSTSSVHKTKNNHPGILGLFSQKPRYFIQVAKFRGKPPSRYLSRIKKARLRYTITKGSKSKLLLVGPYSSYAQAKKSIGKVNRAIGAKGFIVKSK